MGPLSPCGAHSRTGVEPLRKDRPDYEIGLPRAGTWREALNTDAEIYGGAGRGNMGAVTADGPPSHGQAVSGRVYLPPLSTVILVEDTES